MVIDCCYLHDYPDAGYDFWVFLLYFTVLPVIAYLALCDPVPYLFHVTILEMNTKWKEVFAKWVRLWVLQEKMLRCAG